MKRARFYIKIVLLVLVSACALFVCSLHVRARMESYANTAKGAAALMNAVLAQDTESILSSTAGGGEAFVPETPESALGKAFFDAYYSSFSYTVGENTEAKSKEAYQSLKLAYLDLDKLASAIKADMEIRVESLVQNSSSGEVYDENLNYLPGVLETAFAEAVESQTQNTGNFLTSQSVIFSLHYEDGMWKVQPTEELSGILVPVNMDEYAEALCRLLEEDFPYIRKEYSIEKTALKGGTPDPTKYGETDDPAVITELLATPIAQQLLNGQETVWNPEIERIPDTLIRYYLDETILVLAWQEKEACAVGTFAEVVIADGSQLRRKLAGDAFESGAFEYATELARETNAELATGGDLYDHASRKIGICVYNGELCRYDQSSSDTCYFTAEGDMLFSYINQFSGEEEAKKFISDHDIQFSICFGPVLIDNGKDVTPDFYRWGEIGDYYARAAIGQMGERHYLTMTINCKFPGYYYLATLRQAADAMVKRGCLNAYTLDGGQTASIIMNNELINPVQFGTERLTSDILYFATAMNQDAG